MMRVGLFGCVIPLALLVPRAFPQDPPRTAAPKNSIEVTDEANAAIERGLSFLASRQSAGGSFGHAAPMATTGLVGLAFLGAGHLPGRSKYGDVVKNILDYIMNHRSHTGYINEGSGRQRGQGGSGLHGHGYATLFLAELYGAMRGTDGRDMEEVRQALVDAIHLIETSQAPNGGWIYEPNQRGDEGSVTITMVMPLRAAKNAGVQVSLDTIEKAEKYIDKSTQKNGMTQYSLTMGNQTSWALTAAGQSVLTYLGKYQDDRVAKGLDYLMKNAPFGEATYKNSQGWGSWYFYGSLYATLAMYQAGGRWWEQWCPRMRDELVKRQVTTGGTAGAWTGAESGMYGPEFGTACALIMLEVPYRLLPILQSPED